MSRDVYMRAPDGAVYRTDHPEYWTECERLPAKEGAALYRAQVAKELRAMLKPGKTVYTQLTHVSASGMSRRIALKIATIETRNGKRTPCIRDITYGAAALLDVAQGSDGGITVGGCGFDAGFDLVYRLGRALWPKGTAKPHGTRNGEPDRDGGYALRHEWL